MLSCWTQSSPPSWGGVVNHMSSISPRTEPWTRPEGRPAIRITPVTSLPFCSSVNVIGKGLSSPVVVPVQVPATSAVGALSAACRASQAALHPVVTITKAKSNIGVVFIASFLQTYPTVGAVTITREITTVDGICLVDNPSDMGRWSHDIEDFESLHFQTLRGLLFDSRSSTKASSNLSTSIRAGTWRPAAPALPEDPDTAERSHDLL